MERIILHLDMDAFFAACEQKTHPVLRGKPVLVCGNPATRSVVAACSYEAKSYGIRSGMSTGEALRFCPWAVLVRGDFDKYEYVSSEIFNRLKAYTPLVEIFSIDEAFLDVSSTCSFFGTPLALAKKIQGEIDRNWGLPCSIGIAPNKLLAKLASGLKKPKGIMQLSGETIPPLLENLPVEELCGIGEKTREALFRMGIITCGELGRASEETLFDRFGIAGPLLKRMGQGLDESPVLPETGRDVVKSMSHAYTLPRDSASLEELASLCLHLSEKVGRRLRHGGYQGCIVTLTVRYRNFSTFSRRKRLGRFLDDGYDIHQVACRILKGVDLSPRIRLLGVGISGLVPRQPQGDLFEEKKRRLLLAGLDRVNDRYGEETVCRASILAPLIRKTHGFSVREKLPLGGEDAEDY